MKNDEKNKKLNQKLKTGFSQKVLSTTWEKEGMEVSNIFHKYLFISLQLYFKIILKKDKFILTSEEKKILKYFISKGTPEYFRQNLWILCSRAKQDLANNTFYYDDLLKLSKEVPSLYEKQIDKDIY